jgi:hypothetical protein
MRRIVLIIVVCLFACLIALALCETYLRIKHVQPYERTFPNHDYDKVAEVVWWAQSDVDLGWTGNKNMPGINPQGFREKRDFDRLGTQADKTRIMILGDSFMYGTDAWPSITMLLEMKLQNQYDAFNLAVPGWGIDQMYLAYVKYRDTLRPDLVILAFIDEDVARVLEAFRRYEGLSKPSFEVQNGDLVVRASAHPFEVSVNRLLGKSIFLSHIMQEFYLWTVARPLVETIFSKMAQDTQRRNETFIVLRIPTPRNLYGGKEQNFFVGAVRKVMWRLKSFQTISQTLHLHYLEPLEAMTNTPDWVHNLYLNDGHLSEAGNKQLAEYLYKEIIDHQADAR